MTRLLPSLILTLLVGILAACGSRDDEDQKATSKDQVILDPPTTVQPPTTSAQLPDTSIIGSDQIPSVVAARELPLYFRSSDPDATFECRQSAQAAFQACPEGDAFFFRGLIQGGSYRMEVRARTSQGLVDPTPAKVEFRVDQSAGTLPYGGGQGVLVVEKPADLPTVASNAAGASRRMQLGSMFFVNVPLDMTVSSYSTTRTLNANIHLMSVIDPDRPAGAGAEGCRRDWEKIVVGQNRSLFCDATPTREQMRTYARPLPFDHIEMVGEQSGEAYEKLLLSTFDDGTDPTEANMNLQRVCAGSAVQGTSQMRVFSSNLDRSRQVQSVRWCRVIAGNSGWWIALVEGRLGKHQNAARLKAIYTISESRGVRTPQQFAARIQGFLPRLVQHLAP